jgi:hypothetical protein
MSENTKLALVALFGAVGLMIAGLFLFVFILAPVIIDYKLAPEMNKDELLFLSNLNKQMKADKLKISKTDYPSINIISFNDIKIRTSCSTHDESFIVYKNKKIIYEESVKNSKLPREVCNISNHLYKEQLLIKN